MSLLRMSTFSLCLAGISVAGSSLANQQDQEHQGYVVLVAMEQICNKNNPGLNGDVENAMATEPKFNEAAKAQIRKIKSDPAYKFQVSNMVSTLTNSPLGAMAQDMCKEYAPK
ncbi:MULTISPECIES: hypothetical protein [Pseudomonas]|uniref:Uncharacterized protein n=1 Tax=Pseudomonas canavaninivorans TaxID=2842348 RepID=A0ABX8Q8P2_PSECO|nr:MULTISPECIES: hypothetical protein [Pseudomonas]QXI51661.1 hypothetical protein KSS97_19210 [Pseudomonas alvandae]UVM70667.1 hypothetical protein LOY40_18955 [Pseudomonas canavaninivorans]